MTLQTSPVLEDDAARDREAIRASHRRSRAYGLDPALKPDPAPLATARVAELVGRHQALYRHALPVMESLYENIVNTHSMVVLTDAQGTILHALGDDDFLTRAQKIALAPGVEWSERSKGTNAIGTAIADRAPTLVHADEHYLRANQFLTCSAVPIADPQGEVCGVLDVSGDFRSYHQHTMALVRMSGQIIENQLFCDAHAQSVRVRFHNRPEFIGTLMEGIAAFDAHGRYLGANRSARQQFGLGPHALETHTFHSLFGMPMSALVEHYRCWNPGPIQTRLHNGLIVHLRAEGKGMPRWTRAGFVPEASPPADASPQAEMPVPAELPTRGRAPAFASLNDLDTGDAQVAAAIARLRKVIDRDLPILIVGETGTGKELLAQAIHRDSARAGMPLVAVNCAAIPDTLIESELFGYVDGAFTGARKRGQPGKIVAANGGTLFLDEIGDMPLALQARLLRVLQDRVVTPLGGHQGIAVNVMVVCATHHDPRALVAQGRFREDLYYRLNGVVVRLPALRERSDLDALVERILRAGPQGGTPRPPYTLAPEVRAAFARHAWPGNLRQLDHALRAAMLMTDDDHVIRREHLPEDMLGAYEAVSATAGGASSLEDAERDLIRRALDAHAGNVSATARALGIGRNTVYRKLARGA